MRRESSAKHANSPYHHGDLRAALLDATDRLARAAGLETVTLRAVAREAGVSHAAPAHHFRDKRALFAAYAAQGWDRMGAVILDSLAREAPRGPRETLSAVGRAYLVFARTDPARFQAMFRRDLYDPKDPGVRAAGEATWRFLEDTIASAHPGEDRAEPRRTLTAMAWSAAHGFAALEASGRLRAQLPGASEAGVGEAMIDRLAELMLPED
ncbi:TetR/AcrR family transcriptional regulator [Marinicauda algicola]|uniref:TetR/AcrR family transcriptional regulator n=1 Tax=Marinicauda algicola TaxID=2029849 RepID=A0A4S2H195_9PROT|nr:TetR/AcrR family transcriptional regulator [Marinicauda algicola]TGY89295.1 TetR/AcrR family transcriptional regulator [Marinicauda algicola]